MRLRHMTTAVIVGGSTVLAIPCDAAALSGELVQFDAPGAATTVSAICATQCGTIAYANNDEGTVVGSYTDEFVVPHGFIRKRDAHIISFDAPGAGLGSYLNQGTVPYSINAFGVIAGQYEDSNNVFHGFIRYPDGSIVSFDAAGAGTVAGAGTLAYSINVEGETAGVYIDDAGGQHGFVRSPWGEITEFDPPGSVYTMVCEETCLNREGTATGAYVDANQVLHGFARMRNGTFVTFEAPNAGTGGNGVTSISDRGEIAGYLLATDNSYYGFVRHPNGTFSANFQFPSPGPGTIFYSINALGVTAGDYLDANFAFHGLSRWPSGEVKTFDAPNAGAGAFQGTRTSTNNTAGEVAGWYVDSAGLNHGFVWRK